MSNLRLLRRSESPLCADPVPAGITVPTRPGRKGNRISGRPLLAIPCHCREQIATEDTCLRCGHLLTLEGFGRAA